MNDVERWLARIPIWGASADLRVEPVPETTTNRTYRVATDRGCWAVRLPNHALAGVDRQREVRVLERVARAGLGPRLVYSNPETGLLVTEWIEGRVWTAADLHDHGNLSRLANRLGELHRLPWEEPGVEPTALAEPYVERLWSRQPALGEVVRQLLLERVGRLEPQTSVLCHRDLLHDNIIEADELMLLDWEYAGGGEPLFDLAAVIRYHDLDDTECGVLLETYGRVDRARLERFGILIDTLTVAWAACLSAGHPGQARAARLAAAARARLRL